MATTHMKSQHTGLSYTNSPYTNLQTLVHDLAGPLTVLSMCFPEVEKQLRTERNIPPSPHLHRCIQLCAAALQETQQKLKKLQVYGDEESKERR